MSKVICDVCGTAYPETAATCPICGSAKNSTEQTAAALSQREESVGYTYVRGGRFSKSNVRKRNKKSKTVATAQADRANSANKGLVIVILLLLLAIIAVLCYIGVRFLFPETQDAPPSSSQQQEDPKPDNDGVIACTGLTLSREEIDLPLEGSAILLSVEREPMGCTEQIFFESSDDTVATVNDLGNIVAVGGGEAIITVTCGEVTKQCKVVCSFGEPQPPEGGEEETDPPSDVPEGFVLELKHTQFSITETYPNPVSVYKKNDLVAATDITWTSDDEAIATIDEKGVVTAVSRGTTNVHGQIGDQKVSCKVYVSLDPASIVAPKYTISHSDVTLNIGADDSFRLTLKDPEKGGAVVQDVVWTANEEGYVEIDGKNITAIKSTSDLANRYILVSATVEEYTYSCKIYIHQPKTEE